MVIIIGVSGGLGKKLYKKLYLSEQKVIGTYFSNKPDSDLVNMYKVDVNDFNSIQNWIEKIYKELSKIKVVICSGSNYNSFAHKADPDSWAKLIHTNLIGPFNIVRCLLPIMREQEFGRIVFISSVVPQIGVVGTSAYSASKSGLWGLSKAVSKENASRGITSNCINPGYMDAGMTYDIPEKFLDKIKETIPLNRFGTMDELFNTVNYLFETPYLTGTTIDINGGLY